MMNRITLVVCFALTISGCISIPNSPSSRFYSLTRSIDNRQEIKIVKIKPGVLIAVGPVKIPEYLDRPQIVTIGPDKTIQFAQFDRWSETLDLGLARLIRSDFTGILSK